MLQSPPVCRCLDARFDSGSRWCTERCSCSPGAALLAVTYLLVRFAFPTASTRTYNAGHPPMSGHGTRLAPLPSLASAQAQNARQRNADLHQLLAISGVTLAGMVVVSLGLGWLVTGRVLVPLRTITATAREISSDTLDRRLAPSGPDDELKDFGDTLRRAARPARGLLRLPKPVPTPHELRTPLTLQRALLEAALTKPEANADSFRATCERLLLRNPAPQELFSKERLEPVGGFLSAGEVGRAPLYR